MAPAYKKRLEGVKINDSLESLLEEALMAASQAKIDDFEDENEDPLHPYSKAKAVRVLNAFQQEKGHNLSHLPIPVIRSMKAVLDDKSDDLETALKSTSLVFTAKPSASNLTEGQQKFQQRMEQLRFRQEQRRYAKLTHNLTKVIRDDDVSTKSMTYAASIGLNMVIAPISFGVFMYFFGGSLLDFLFPRKSTSTTDIRKVIIGVVSGVLMLFIEMLLFVIRTHEMDKAIRKKERKTPQTNPFSYYTSDTRKTYKDK